MRKQSMRNFHEEQGKEEMHTEGRGGVMNEGTQGQRKSSRLTHYHSSEQSYDFTRPPLWDHCDEPCLCKSTARVKVRARVKPSPGTVV